MFVALGLGSALHAPTTALHASPRVLRTLQPSGCSPSEAWFTTSSSKYGRGLDGAFEVLGVASGANASDIKRAYRLRARELHPDVCDDPGATDRFQKLVDAYRQLQDVQPGSVQAHPCWDQLPEFYHHWALELGHTTESLEEWITKLQKTL